MKHMPKPKIYYTINHVDTHEPLGLGGPLGRLKARAILLAARPVPLIRTEWYVTVWHGNGSDSDEIIGQMLADEWLDDVNGR
jgi:hypothetical protein